MRIRFLIDEDLPPRIKAMLLRQDPTIDVLRVGDSGAPPHGTKDPDIVRYVALQQRLLITNNRRTMGVHATTLLTTGMQHWGILRAGQIRRCAR